MQYELITPPSVEPFILADLKSALRIDHDEDDGLVMQLGQAARRQVERRLSHAIADQTWQVLITSGFDQPITLRPGRVREVTAVEAQYGDNPWTPIDEWTLRVGAPACLMATLPPSADGEPLTAVRASFRTGRADVADTPHDLIQAITMLTAH
ncbi:MAG: phage head-tail connector protein, partial [Parvularculaceae bacterium]|nr:phage head-tail connector protein [Parvularculaceae bacterium]